MRTLIAILLSAAGLCGASLKAGIGRVDITPAGPIWMSGYAARTHASEGTLTPLWAKALALESGPGRKIVIVTTDVVGVPRVVVDEVAARVEKQHGLKRAPVSHQCQPHPHRPGRLAESPEPDGVPARRAGETARLPTQVYRRPGGGHRRRAPRSRPGHRGIRRGLRRFRDQSAPGSQSEPGPSIIQLRF